MGDMGAMYNDWKKDGQTRRANNRANSPTMLDEAGINYESKNTGSHLIVTGPDGLGGWSPCSSELKDQHTKRSEIC